MLKVSDVWFLYMVILFQLSTLLSVNETIFLYDTMTIKSIHNVNVYILYSILDII